MGNGDPTKSALFFTGTNVTPERFTNMRYQSRGFKMLLRIVKRNTWINFQRTRLRKEQDKIQTNELNLIFKWAQETRITKNKIQ